MNYRDSSNAGKSSYINALVGSSAWRKSFSIVQACICSQGYCVRAIDSLKNRFGEKCLIRAAGI
jgi:hypothetical protein